MESKVKLRIKVDYSSKGALYLEKQIDTPIPSKQFITTVLSSKPQIFKIIMRTDSELQLDTLTVQCNSGLPDPKEMKDDLTKCMSNEWNVVHKTGFWLLPKYNLSPLQKLAAGLWNK